MPIRFVSACVFVSLLAVSSPVSATTVYRPQVESITVFTGTGFYITNRGYAVTNHHVIEGCEEVTLRGTGVDPVQAKVIASDTEFDLALLKADVRVRRPAKLRELNISRLEVGESVMVMGYPKEAFESGKYKVVASTITGLKGMTDEPQYIQFSDAAQKGNSGGPLLDSAGNVAGVIVGKAELFSVDRRTGQQAFLRASDLAISLTVLRRFLDSHWIGYEYDAGMGYMMNERIEEDARGYIVNVICERPDLSGKR